MAGNQFNEFYSNINQVIVGKKMVAKKLLIAILAQGHVLIEDVPGVGKTTLAKAMAYSLDSSFSRIQFTPDLLPTDILGVSIFNQKINAFEYKKGPIFNQVVLSDEINRASPKTQSSLLEAMEERQITMDGQTYELKEPFLVIATQNPIEYEGTFALPEAQLDRFMMKIAIGYPAESVESEIFKKIKLKNTAEKLKPVFTSKDIISFQEKVNDVYTDESVEKYIFDLVRKTRENEDIILGCSPRAAIALYKACKAKAFIENRSFVTPLDVQELAPDVLSHRIILNQEVIYRGKTSKDIIQSLLKTTKAPRRESYDQ